MKDFLKLEFEPRICRSQLAEFQQLLQSKQSLSERDDILPFFRQRLHLSAFVASYHPQINRFDRVAFEYDLFGDFTADLVVGDSVNLPWLTAWLCLPPYISSKRDRCAEASHTQLG